MKTDKKVIDPANKVNEEILEEMELMSKKLEDYLELEQQLKD